MIKKQDARFVNESCVFSKNHCYNDYITYSILTNTSRIQAITSRIQAITSRNNLYQ